MALLCAVYFAAMTDPSEENIGDAVTVQLVDKSDVLLAEWHEPSWDGLPNDSYQVDGEQWQTTSSTRTVGSDGGVVYVVRVER